MTQVGRELSYDAVIDAAVRVVEAEGLDAVTGNRIAAVLDVSQPALYRHIDSMDDVWRGLSLAGRRGLIAALTDAALGRSGADAVISVAEAWRAFARSNAALYAATDRYPTAGDAELEEAVGQLVGVLAMSMRGFGLSEEPAVDAARLLRSFLHGFVHLELGDGHPHPLENDVSFNRIVGRLVAMFSGLSSMTFDEG